jgi:hypothetical protein
MPWVRIPVGPCKRDPIRTVPLKCGNEKETVPTNRCTTPRKRGWEGSNSPPEDTGACDDTVCTCDPGVHWTRSSGYSVYHQTWLLCQLVDGSARVPTKDVPSCDKPRGPARRVRTEDFRMGIPAAIASRNGERRELKHLSIGRKRNQNGMSLVTASERDPVQTEAFGQCGVRTDSHRRNVREKSSGTKRDTG